MTKYSLEKMQTKARSLNLQLELGAYGYYALMGYVGTKQIYKGFNTLKEVNNFLDVIKEII